MSSMPFRVISVREENRLKLIERAVRLAEEYKTKTLEQIAAQEGVTRERVRQILSTIGIKGTDGWRYKLTRSKCAEIEAKRVAKRERVCQERYGCDYNTYCRISGFSRLLGRTKNYSIWGKNIVSVYWTNKLNAQRACIPWKLTLPEYAELVGSCVGEIGRGKLHVARKDKNGPYSKENCELMSNSVNSTLTRHSARRQEQSEETRLLLRMQAAGMSYEQMAKSLAISEGTVKIRLYKANNRAKFGG